MATTPNQMCEKHTWRCWPGQSDDARICVSVCDCFWLCCFSEPHAHVSDRSPLQLHTSLLLQRTHAHARAYAALVISLSLKGHFCWLRHIMPAKIRPPSDLWCVRQIVPKSTAALYTANRVLCCWMLPGCTGNVRMGSEAKTERPQQFTWDLRWSINTRRLEI